MGGTMGTRPEKGNAGEIKQTFKIIFPSN